MFLYNFRFSHVACVLLAAGCGIAAGNALLTRFGSYIDGTNTVSDSLFSGFISGFFVTLIPLLAVIVLSVTIYAAPVALGALALECAQDTYYILSTISFLKDNGAGALLPSIFFICARFFFAYCYLLLTLRTLYYRSETKTLSNRMATVLSGKSRKFFRDYTAVAGLICVSGFFTHIIFYFS